MLLEQRRLGAKYRFFAFCFIVKLNHEQHPPAVTPNAVLSHHIPIYVYLAQRLMRL
jgi:hypothetical protein